MHRAVGRGRLTPLLLVACLAVGGGAAGTCGAAGRVGPGTAHRRAAPSDGGAVGTTRNVDGGSTRGCVLGSPRILVVGPVRPDLSLASPRPSSAASPSCRPWRCRRGRWTFLDVGLYGARAALPTRRGARGCAAPEHLHPALRCCACAARARDGDAAQGAPPRGWTARSSAVRGAWRRPSPGPGAAPTTRCGTRCGPGRARRGCRRGRTAAPRGGLRRRCLTHAE